MSVLLHTQVRFEGDPQARLAALSGGLAGSWASDPAADNGTFATRCNEAGRAVTLELRPTGEHWTLELSTHPVVDLRRGSTLVGIAAGLCVAASLAAGIYVIVPLGFQLALPVGILVFLGTTFGLAVAVPIVVDKLRRRDDDQALAVKIREVIAADDELELA